MSPLNGIVVGAPNGSFLTLWQTVEPSISVNHRTIGHLGPTHNGEVPEFENPSYPSLTKTVEPTARVRCCHASTTCVLFHLDGCQTQPRWSDAILRRNPMLAQQLTLSVGDHWTQSKWSDALLNHGPTLSLDQLSLYAVIKTIRP